MSASRRRQRRSAREASVPRPLHGASSRTASKAPSKAAGSSRTSACTTSTPYAPSRSRFWRIAPRRGSSTSTAVTSCLAVRPRRAAPSWCPARRTGRGCGAPGPAAGGGHHTGDLRAPRLRRHEAVAERRRAFERRAVVDERRRQPRHAAAREAGGDQRRARRRHVGLERVHAQAALRGRVGGREKPLRGVVAELAAQQLDQPHGARVAHRPGASAVAVGERGEALPPVLGDLAQHGVHEALRALALAARPAPRRRRPRRRRARGRGRAAGTPPGAGLRAPRRRCRRAAPW